MDKEDKIALDYARAKPRRRRWLTLAITIGTAVALLVGARWVKSSWPGCERRYYIYRCLHFQGAPGSVAMGQPDCWFRITRNGVSPPNATVFLHERTAANGTKRLVWVEGFPSAAQDDLAKSLGGDPGQFLDFELWTYDPAKLYVYGNRISTYQGNPQTSWVVGQGRQLTLLNGQPDPVDLSHFTFMYDLDSARGTIDGWLLDDSSIRLRIRDGPAVASMAAMGWSLQHN